MTQAATIPDENKLDHTKRAYVGLADAYAYFNADLFGGVLPTCLITMQRKKNCLGYFHSQKFQNGETVTDEIALNPANFMGRSHTETLSTLVHEQAHLWHQHFGANPPKNGYHGKVWADKMEEIGLMPYNIKNPEKKTGPLCSHKIMEGGKFALACARYLIVNELALYQYLQDAKSEGKAKKKAASKTKYTCEMCGTNAWAKPDTRLLCGICEDCMLPEGE